MLGLALFTSGSLAWLSTDDVELIVMRGLPRLGAAIVLRSALAIVMNMFEEGVDRNRTLGIRGALMASGVTVGLIAQPGARCVPAEHRSLV